MADQPADAQQPNTQDLPQIDVQRVHSFEKNLAYLCNESLELFGLPVDVLLAQVFSNASQQGMSAMGKMVNFGQGSMFVPNAEILQQWIGAYFERVLPKGNDMAEA